MSDQINDGDGRCPKCEMDCFVTNGRSRCCDARTVVWPSGSLHGVVQRRRYINPNFLRDHAEKPLAIRSVEYVDDKCVVEVARMAGSGECWLPDKYSYDAHEIPEADVAQAWKPLKRRHQRPALTRTMTSQTDNQVKPGARTESEAPVRLHGVVRRMTQRFCIFCNHKEACQLTKVNDRIVWRQCLKCKNGAGESEYAPNK